MIDIGQGPILPTERLEAKEIPSRVRTWSNLSLRSLGTNTITLVLYRLRRKFQVIHVFNTRDELESADQLVTGYRMLAGWDLAHNSLGSLPHSLMGCTACTLEAKETGLMQWLKKSITGS